MDGIIIDSEEHWDRARRAVVASFGGTYHDRVAHDVMGMSPPEWSRYLRTNVGVPLAEDAIEAEMVARLREAYRRDRPFYAGAVATVRAIAARYPTAIASASGRDLIDLVVEIAGLGDAFSATVAAAEAGRGKPAPDVYLAAAAKLGVAPEHCVAVEDSGNGMRAAKNAGMWLVAVPNVDYPPDAEALALADLVLGAIAEFTPDVVERLG